MRLVNSTLLLAALLILYQAGSILLFFDEPYDRRDDDDRDHGPKLAVMVMHERRRKCIRKIRKRHFETMSDVLVEQKVAKWKNRAMLVDPAMHGNVGDSMLVFGEYEFLRSLGFGRENPDRFAQCGVAQSLDYLERCTTEEELRPFEEYKLAFWHAGGNFGNLWTDIHNARVKNVELLLKAGKTVVGMPQSLHYDEGVKPTLGEDVARWRESIADGLTLRKGSAELDTPHGRDRARSRVILLWRDRASYDTAVEHFPFLSHRLMPDIAFQIGPFMPLVDEVYLGNYDAEEAAALVAAATTHSSKQPMKSSYPSTNHSSYSSTNHSNATVIAAEASRHLPEKVDLLLLLRNDKESTGVNRTAEHWRRHLDGLPGGRGAGVTFRVADWGDRSRVLRQDYHLFSQSSVDLLAVGRVVVADRLHAGILAFLSDVPFVYVNQRTGKVSGAFDVAMGSWKGCRDEGTLMYGGSSSMEGGIDKALDMLYKNNLRDV